MHVSFTHTLVCMRASAKFLFILICRYHLKTFYKPSTQYYIRSSQLFYTNLVRSPALFFVSKTDQVGNITSNLRVKERWDTLGVKVGYVNTILKISYFVHTHTHTRATYIHTYIHICFSDLCKSI